MDRRSSPKTKPSAGSGLRRADCFVGYGINAPEYNWNDYDGVDMKARCSHHRE